MFSSLLFSTFIALSTAAAAPPQPQGAHPHLAGYVTYDHEDVIPDDYIIHFHEGHTLDRHYATIGRNFSDLGPNQFTNHAWLPGYRAKLDDNTLHELVRRDPGVKMVEHNIFVRRDEPERHPEVEEHFIDNSTRPGVKKRWEMVETDWWQPGPRMVAWWQRIGKSRFDPTPVQQGVYPYLAEAGQGVRIYILDGGINLAHAAFDGRAVNFHNWTRSPYVGEPMEDQDGHGTHVAGIAGGRSIGVAPYSTLVNVKVFNSSGYTDINSVAYGVQDVVQEHLLFRNNTKYRPSGWRGSVINFSGSTSVPNSFFKAVWFNAFNAGIPMAVSAGNNNVDASSRYPCAYYLTTVCVGATTTGYIKWANSNYGKKLLLAAPGAGIMSADFDNIFGLKNMSGTSMAAPHVAGAIAIWMGWEAFVNDADRATDLILYNSQIDWMAGWINTGTVNRFLGTGIWFDFRGGPYIGSPREPVGEPGTFDNPALDTIDDIAASAAWAVKEGQPVTFGTDGPITKNAPGATATITISDVSLTTDPGAANTNADESVQVTTPVFTFAPTSTAT